MNRILWMVAFLCGQCVPNAVAQWIVEDPALINIGAQQSLKLAELELSLNRTNLLLQQIDERVGASSLATVRLENDRAFITNVGRMGSPDNSLPKLEPKANVRQSLVSQTNSYRTQTGDTMSVLGKELQRDPARYNYTLKTEFLVRELRQNAEVNRMHQHELLSRLAGANERFERASTLAEVGASTADFLRLTSLMNAAANLSENLDRDLRLRSELKSLAEKESAMRKQEYQLARGKVRREATAKQATSSETRRALLLKAGAASAWNVKELAERHATQEIN